MTTPERSGRIGLVPARYGPGLVGGAEIVLAEMADGLEARGWDVEILTTCATDHHTWRNELPEGLHDEGGRVVRRFPVVNEPNPERGALESAILQGHRLGLAEQQRWINGGMRVPGLYQYLLEHAKDYRALIFTPYPFWPTFACSQIAPERSVLWTCLHDEPYAYLELFQPVFSGSAGLLLQSGPEHDLAHQVCQDLAPHALVGCGVPVPEHYDADRFRAKYGIEGRFVLYAGRREGAKGWDDLMLQLRDIYATRDLQLTFVTMGRGDLNCPPEIADKVVDVGFLPDDERDDAFAAADAYIQPSRYEAFSRTIMEAWLAGTPVIGNRGSDVVAWHCERSGSGLLYDDVHELAECLSFVADCPEDAAKLAESGREYVLSQYRWADVLDRIEANLTEWTRP